MKIILQGILLFCSISLFGQSAPTGSTSGYSQNTLSKLLDKDTISINYHKQGCFSLKFSKILIRKENEKFVAELYDSRWAYITRRKKTTLQHFGDSLLKSIVLTEKNIQDFIHFENELNSVTDNRCTTTERYEIKSRYLNLKAVDGSCQWRGYAFLHGSFFGDDNGDKL